MPLLTAPQLRRTDTVCCVSVFVGRLTQPRKGRKVSKTGKKNLGPRSKGMYAFCE